MKINRYAVIGLVIGLMIFATGCASSKKAFHKYIKKGQITDVVDNGNVLFCTGSSDLASVGQQYIVTKNIEQPGRRTKGGFPVFIAEQTGVIKITEIVDEYYATGAVISGKAEVNSTVNLK